METFAEDVISTSFWVRLLELVVEPAKINLPFPVIQPSDILLPVYVIVPLLTTLPTKSLDTLNEETPESTLNNGSLAVFLVNDAPVITLPSAVMKIVPLGLPSSAVIAVVTLYSPAVASTSVLSPDHVLSGVAANT